MVMHLASSYVAEVRRAVEEAAESDYVMPIWLPFLPSILVAVGFLLAIPLLLLRRMFLFMSSLVLLIILSIAGSILAFYVLYKLISRRNMHFKRTVKIYGNAVSLLDSLGVTDPETVQLKNLLQEMQREEGERSTGLWIILSFLTGLAALYVYHFLNKDFYKHELREKAFYENLSRILEKRGISLGRLKRTVPNRSTVLYIILMIFTLGFFNLYWLYTLAKDPNEHFAAHRAAEAEIVNAFERLVNLFEAV